MAKYMLIYQGASTDLSQMSQEDAAKVLAGWQSWMSKVGSALVDVGTPFGGGATVVDDGSQGETIPLSGYSIYDEHLERKGEGLHHVKLYHRDCAKAVAHYERLGYPVIQSGRIDEDEHYYLDTEKDFGYIVELGNAGRIRAAERRYPE